MTDLPDLDADSPDPLLSKTRNVKTSARQPGALFFILSYQQEHCIAECLQSALAQDYSNLSIVVSDDASIDRTAEVIQDLLSAYRGPHRVRFIQQPRNLRIHHVNALIPEFLKEPYIVMGHGDDVFHPDRVGRSVAAMLRDRSFSATCNAVVIDKNGNGDRLYIDPDSDHDLTLPTLCRELTNRACFGAGMAWHRAVFTQFGKLRPGPRQVDQIIVFRSTLLGGASLIRDPLMRYRIHDSNLNMTRMLELASGIEKTMVEERRRNNVVATAIAFRELLNIAREKAIGTWNYDELDSIITRSILDKTARWVLFRSKMADEGIGIY